MGADVNQELKLYENAKKSVGWGWMWTKNWSYFENAKKKLGGGGVGGFGVGDVNQELK